jgi:hypothetical protein
MQKTESRAHCKVKCKPSTQKIDISTPCLGSHPEQRYNMVKLAAYSLFCLGGKMLVLCTFQIEFKLIAVSEDRKKHCKIL